MMAGSGNIDLNALEEVSRTNVATAGQLAAETAIADVPQEPAERPEGSGSIPLHLSFEHLGITEVVDGGVDDDVVIDREIEITLMGTEIADRSFGRDRFDAQRGLLDGDNQPASSERERAARRRRAAFVVLAGGLIVFAIFVTASTVHQHQQYIINMRPASPARDAPGASPTPGGPQRSTSSAPAEAPAAVPPVAAAEARPAITPVPDIRHYASVGVKIRIESIPSGADVRDLASNTIVGRTPLSFTLPSSRGPHRFALQRENYVDIVVEVPVNYRDPDITIVTTLERSKSPPQRPSAAATRTPALPPAGSEGSISPQGAMGPRTVGALETSPIDANAGSDRASVLFSHGRALMQQGKYAEACTEFEQSQRLYPASSTQYNLARCYVEIGKLATAWTLYRELAQIDQDAERRANSDQLAAQLLGRVSKLKVALQGAPAGVSVSMNDINVTALLGLEMPVDLGTYTIVADLPNHRGWRKTVEVKKEGEVIVIDIGR
jgi:hypothetical protein